jgi:ElaB/YqjD/DUF883 family membrane-anchored ribosome-binding protein
MADEETKDEGKTPTDAPPADDRPAWRKQLESSFGDLRELGTDIRGRLEKAGHTAQTEAKETWKKLEPQLEAAEKKVREATDDAVEQLEGLFGRLKGSLQNLRGKVDQDPAAKDEAEAKAEAEPETEPETEPEPKPKSKPKSGA